MTQGDPKHLFLDRLRKLHRRTLLRVGWIGAVRVLGVGGSLLTATAWLLGGADHPARFVTYGLLVSLGLGLLALLWTQLLGRLWALRKRRQLVQVLEKRGYFSNLLVAGEEALRDESRWDQGQAVTGELRRRLHRRAGEVLQRLGPADAVPLNRTRLSWLAAATGLLLLVSLVTAPGQTLEKGWQRMAHPELLWQAPATGGLYAVQGPGFVVAGHDLEIAALDATLDLSSAICEIRVGSGLWQTVPVRRETPASAQPSLKPPFRQWVAQVQQVQEDFQWRFRRGSMVSEEQQVVVRHHPLITDLGGAIQPPTYTRLKVRDMPRLPTWIEAAVGSRLTLRGETNHPVQSLSLITEQGDTLGLQFTDRSFTGSLEINNSTSFHLVLVDSFGLHNQEALRYEVVATEDSDPTVNLVREDDDGVLPINGQVDLVVDAADDYGLQSLAFNIRLLDESSSRTDVDFHSLPLWSRGSAASLTDWKEQQTPWGTLRLQTRALPGVNIQDQHPLQTGMNILVDLNALDLVPGDVVEVRAEARDNRQPPPRGRGLSETLKFSLPSAADVLAAQADSSQERRGDLEEMRRRGRQLGADLDRLTRELLKNPVPDWARQQEMEAAIERQKKMQEELSRVAQQLQKDVERLASGQMTSEKMQQQAEEMSQLLDPQTSESLEDMMRRMENNEGKMSPEELSEAMKEVARNQKEMARKLDAALAMLQNMDREQEMEGLASLLEKMIRKQQELADLSREMAEQQKEQSASEGQESSEGESPDGESQESESSESESGGDQESSDNSDQESGEKSDQEQSSDQESPSAEELARRQEALADEMEQLKEKLEEALAKMEEQNADKPTPGSEEMQAALEQALEQMEKQKSQESMDEASEQMAQMNPEQAAQLQQQALRDMGSLYSVILKSQSAMQAAMDQNQVTSLRQLASDMLVLSARQESIASAIPPRIRDVRSLDLTRHQHRVQKAAIGVRDRLSELSSENPTRIMRLLEKLDEVIETMGSSLNALENNRAATARTGSTNSLAQANRMVIGLLTEAQMSSQSSSSGQGQEQQSQMSLSEQLKSMAKDQAELNAMTEQMRQMLANRGMSQQARSQMKRLGEGQGELAGRMNDLAEEARKNPEGERVLGDLGALGEMMETLSQEVEQGLVSEETLIRQERILSRMLDARNSVRQRDYSSRRESRTAKQLYEAENGTLEGNNGAQDDPFELRYQPLENAPLEYRGLVRRYFQALEKFKQNQARQVEVP